MKLRTLTATFGCLDQATLDLRDGLNVLVLPNEQGKSTWAAFLTAMFYGIDTSQRSSRGKLPDKVRYQPWSGKPMCGTVELEWNGQLLVLQRTSERGDPWGRSGPGTGIPDWKSPVSPEKTAAESCWAWSGLCFSAAPSSAAPI